jgi:outer membrane receptor protein involved in Fe transport
MDPRKSRFASLLGSASLLVLSGAGGAQAQQVAQGQTAQAAPAEVPEQVLVTGSLIHGTAAVGVPVTNLGPQDFTQTGSLTTADLFRTIPAANVSPGPVAIQSGANIERATRVNLRGLDTGNAPRTLLLVDGHRFPGQGNGTCEIDPSIVPELALDRIDVLLDGASATYGTNAMAGVINEILKRGYDGAITQLKYTQKAGSGRSEDAAQLWGRTWDGGDITLTYEWFDNTPIKGNFNSRFTVNFTPWGLNDRTPTNSAPIPIVTIGKPAATLGTVCSDCYSVPAGTGANFAPGTSGIGPTAPGSASTLAWASFDVPANNNANNTVNPYTLAWYDAAQQKNSFAGTVDQRLLSWLSVYAEGFYTNRRAEYINPPNLSPNTTNLLNIAVPTFNPYYPSGAPNNLFVLDDIGYQTGDHTDAYELSTMYNYGLNINLPLNWEGKIYVSQEYDSSFNHVTGTVNPNAVSAALGWTISTPNALGLNTGTATWTKPSNVPYLNLFCDPYAYQCNSPTVLSYMAGVHQVDERYWIDEKGGTFDGPLFDLPAGPVRGAIGGLYVTDRLRVTQFDSTGTPTLTAPMLSDSEFRSDWAGFMQINVPVFSDLNNLPFVRKLELEGSWRHDQYNDVGGISVPKVSFNWTVDEDIGLTIRGSWGTSFRAPAFGETSPLLNNAIAAQNNTALNPSSNININCNPVAGSAAARLIHPSVGVGWTGANNNATASAMGCSDGSFGGANAVPTGISFLGGSAVSIESGFRQYVNTNQNSLKPESGNNYSIGGEIAPQIAFLRGLDIQATWYSIKITDVLAGFGNPTASTFNNPALGFAYIVPTDLAAAGVDAAGCSNNNTPQTCPEFEAMVRNLLNNNRNPVNPSILTTVTWINDGGTMNAGYIHLDGIDWNWSYDYDAGDLGAFNIGQTGTYYLHSWQVNSPGSAPVDGFDGNLSAVGGVLQNGVETLPRMRYRARLGWANGPFSTALFMDYQSHFFNSQAAPPNVNFQCTSSGGTVGGGTNPCAISSYTNVEPGYYTFDLSLGYDTGDNPANDYLKHIGLQLVVADLLDKHSPFEYRTSTGGGNPSAFDITKSIQGRSFTLIVTKTW